MDELSWWRRALCQRGDGKGSSSNHSAQITLSPFANVTSFKASATEPDVPSQAHSARFPISTRTHREVFVPMDRAEEKAGPKDVGEQALMRGLDTAYPFFRLGLSLV